MAEYQYCRHCILSDNIPGVKLDSDGLCQYCGKNYDLNKMGINERERSKHYLKDVLLAYKGGSSDYDVLVMYSGGKDSTYLLYLMKEYGLRPLAFYAKNPLHPAYAEENVESVCNKLGVDLIKYELSEEIYKHTIKEVVSDPVKYFGEQNPVCVNPACTVCGSFMFAAAYTTAIKKGIKLVVSGSRENQVPAAKRFFYQGVVFKKIFKGGKATDQGYNDFFTQRFLFSLMDKTLARSVPEQHDLDCINYLDKDFPDVFFPLALGIDKTGDMIKKIDDAGIIDRKRLSHFRTNCWALALFDLFSYQRYNCRHSIFSIAQQVRFGGNNDNFFSLWANTHEEKNPANDHCGDDREFTASEVLGICAIEKKYLFHLASTEEVDRESSTVINIYKDLLQFYPGLHFDAFIEYLVAIKKAMQYYADYFFEEKLADLYNERS